ncbi:TonB-dependent receptor [Hyphomonas sp. FCG-A18]|uniref:TonB-dependent receptor n=1 Tax=Hyphomonas sp. FCG-A18 TaxID=3080019 RepID=UPI002B30619E|nr:TonB-dependent receptor [Hyphomonas sp. FCG-A18]
MSIQKSDTSSPRRIGAMTALAVVLAITAPITSAQTEGDNDAEAEESSEASILLDTVTVTARKRDERLQDVPLSVSALGAAQLEAKKVRSLTDLTVGVPNVSFDDVGTVPGTANFSIRGLGINSSIPSIDPTVGTFVNGVFIGTNAGVVFDVFDLESVQVLRGPQGTLFGRNVTGGAVLLNTKKPGSEWETVGQLAIDGGENGSLNSYLKASTGGPVSEDLGFKITAYYNDDQGWFTNSFDDSDFGAREQFFLRPTVVWTPSDRSEVILRYEYSSIDGDGPAAQSHTNGSGVPGSPVNFDRDSFDFSIDNKGFVEVETHFATAEFNLSVGENGKITNILGYRDLEQDTLSDLDAQPATLFDGTFQIRSEQISNELRYAGTFGDALDIVAGIYYYQNDLKYYEGRSIFGGALTQDGGGDYSVESVGAFMSADYALTDKLELTAGLRYTAEEKSVQVATLSLNVNSPCNVVEGTCAFDFSDSEEWDSFSPKIGLNYILNDNVRLYGHWTRGFRSGGYNLRNSAVDTVNFGPGPFDQEQVDSFEVGLKSEWDRGRFNVALFQNSIQDLQREIQLTDPVVGIVQLIRNTADADLTGAEFEALFQVTDSLVFDLSLGLLDAQYSNVQFDLNGDGVVNAADEALDLPRAPELTYSVGLVHDMELGSWGEVSSRMNYAYRDESAFTDNNLGFILDQEILDIGIDIRPHGAPWELGFYGRNLLDSVLHGTDGQLPATLGPAPLGGTFSPLTKGRVFGAQLTVRF